MSQTERYAAEWIAEMGLAFEAAPAAPESLVELPRPGLPQTQLFALLSTARRAVSGVRALSANDLARLTAPAAQRIG